MDAHDVAALTHYTTLIEQRFPPHLAALLAAMRYGYGLNADALPLPAVRDALAAVADREPTLSREAGRARTKIDERIGVTKRRP